MRETIRAIMMAAGVALLVSAGTAKAEAPLRGSFEPAPAAAAAGGGACDAQARGEAIGQVVASGGDAIAEDRDGCRRHLVCGDVVHEGEILRTAAGAHLRVMAGDVVAVLDGHAAVRLDAGAAGEAPRFHLLAGGLHLIDTAPAADGRVAFSTPHTQGSVRGGDTELFLADEGGERYSVVCEWRGEVAFEGAGTAHRAQPGECTVARTDRPLASTPGERHAFDLGEGGCPVVAVQGLFLPMDVAANLSGGGLTPPTMGSSRILESCAVSGCGGPPQSVPDPGPTPTPDPEPTITTDVIEGPATPITLQ